MLQMDDAGMTEVLEDRHLCSQLALVFVGKPQLVDDLHCHWFSCVSVLPCTGAEEGGSLNTYIAQYILDNLSAAHTNQEIERQK